MRYKHPRHQQTWHWDSCSTIYPYCNRGNGRVPSWWHRINLLGIVSAKAQNHTNRNTISIFKPLQDTNAKIPVDIYQIPFSPVSNRYSAINQIYSALSTFTSVEKYLQAINLDPHNGWWPRFREVFHYRWRGQWDALTSKRVVEECVLWH